MKDKLGWRHRQALNLASMLPDNYQDAVRVLELTKHLVENFYCRSDRIEPRPDPKGGVVSFRSGL